MFSFSLPECCLMWNSTWSLKPGKHLCNACIDILLAHCHDTLLLSNTNVCSLCTLCAYTHLPPGQRGGSAVSTVTSQLEDCCFGSLECVVPAKRHIIQTFKRLKIAPKYECESEWLCDIVSSNDMLIYLGCLSAFPPCGYPTTHLPICYIM